MADEIRIIGVDTNSISDGYHTFAELYEHRIELWITLCRTLRNLKYPVWRCLQHSDGSKFEGWFVLGVGGDGLGTHQMRQITYHLPLSRWEECSFAHELALPPVFDGHTPADVLVRLKQL